MTQSCLDDYTTNISEKPHYIAYDLIDIEDNHTDELLAEGEQILEVSEKKFGFPSLNGMEKTYS